MTHSTKALVIAAALFASFGPAAATAQTQRMTLQSMRLYDLSPESRVAMKENLDLLGVRQYLGDPLSVEQFFLIQRIINDEATLSSKAHRIQNIINQDSPRGILTVRMNAN